MDITCFLIEVKMWKDRVESTVIDGRDLSAAIFMKDSRAMVCTPPGFTTPA